MLLLFAVLLVTLIWQSFETGRFRGGYDNARAVRQHDRLRDTIVEQDQQLSELSHEAARYLRSSQIDTETIRATKIDMRGLFDERAELKKEVGFLRGLLSAQNGPLYIRDVELTLGEDAQQLLYSFALAQALDDFGTTRGKLAITLIGKLDGKQKKLKQTTVKLEFVHYQQVQGSIVLPEGFESQSLRLDVMPSSKKLKKFSKDIAWTQGDNGAL